MTEENNIAAAQNDDQDNTNKAEETKNKGIIRTAGLLTAAGLIGGTFATGYFFADSAVRYAVVKGLETSIGAEANLQTAKVSWQPFGVELEQLQQTDPTKPSHNLFQFQQASAKVNLLELVLGNVVIDEFNVKGLSLDKPRKLAGQVMSSVTGQDPSATDTASQDEENTSGFDVPDAKELLENTDLITEQKAKNLRTVLKAENEKLDEALRGLPNDSALSAYEQDWRQIKNTKIKSLEDVQELKTKIDNLKQKVKQDKAAIELAKSQYKTSKSQIDTAYKELKQAPGQDWQNIKQKYPIDDPNAAAISKVLFGDKIGGYVETAQE